MTIAMRRGACPALSAPMLTGDGLLVRLNLAEGGMPPASLSALCGLAIRHGNGIVEVTARGSLQIRGLTPRSAPPLAADVEALGLDLRDGVPVETSPLAGLDPKEIADPLPLVRAIRAATVRAGLAARLGPKVSVVVDSGGNIDLPEILADVRLTAMRQDGTVRWLLAVGGNSTTARPVALLDESDAVHATLELLEAIAALGITARGRDLESGSAISPVVAEMSGWTEGDAMERQAPPQSVALPLTNGCHAALISLPYGSIAAAELRAFLGAIEADEIRLAPQRSLILICATQAAARAANEVARAHDLIVDPADPRRMVAACPGAPACTSGRMATREIARRIAAAGTFENVHVSGCAKGCAHPAPAGLVLVGTDAGIALIRGGRASDAPFAIAADANAALDALSRNPA